MAFLPWHELKQAEMRLLAERISGNLSPETLDDVKRLLVLVADDPGADEAICYHGAKALVFECDGNVREAIRHREVEIEKIEFLHELGRKNPGDDAAAFNYRRNDLQARRRILEELRGHAT